MTRRQLRHHPNRPRHTLKPQSGQKPKKKRKPRKQRTAGGFQGEVGPEDAGTDPPPWFKQIPPWKDLSEFQTEDN